MQRALDFLRYCVLLAAKLNHSLSIIAATCQSVDYQAKANLVDGVADVIDYVHI